MGHGPVSNEVLLAKIESSYGSDPTPTAGSNAILYRNMQLVPFERLRMFDRMAVRGSLGTMQHIYGGALSALRFEVECKGASAAGVAPELGVLLRGCGLGQTIVTDTSVTYAPVSTGHESVTLYFFEFGRVRHILLGARGSVSIRFVAGEPVMCSFEFIGKRGTLSDQSQPTPTISTIVPVAVKSLPTELGGVGSLIIQDYEFNLNNQIEVPGSVTDAQGFGNVTIVKRDPTISLLKHAELLATVDSYADLAAGTARAFTSGLLGGTAGNRVTLAAGQCHYRGIELGEAEGFRNRRILLGCHESGTADSDFTLAFT